MKSKPLPFSLEDARAMFRYEPESGLFFRLLGDGREKETGAKLHNGYRRVSFNGRPHYAHRVAFLLMTGAVPEEIDHMNRIRSDNRWDNLRPCTRSENLRNSSPRGAIPFKYVQIDRFRCKFRAHVPGILPPKSFVKLQDAMEYVKDHQAHYRLGEGVP